MTDLDLTAYDADAVEHALYGAARARLFEALIDELDEARTPWSWDLGTGSFTVGERTYALQVLGTFWSGDDTFLWAWDHPNIAKWAPLALRTATALHALGEKPGYAVFSQRKISEKWVPHVELAWVSGELSGGHPVFFADVNGTVTVLQVLDAPITMAHFSNAFVPGVLLDFYDDTILPGRRSVRRFLERLGFKVFAEDDADELFAEKDKASLHVTFSGDRVVGVEAEDG